MRAEEEVVSELATALAGTSKPGIRSGYCAHPQQHMDDCRIGQHQGVCSAGLSSPACQPLCS